jgi:hypothetical protein
VNLFGIAGTLHLGIEMAIYAADAFHGIDKYNIANKEIHPAD